VDLGYLAVLAFDYILVAAVMAMVRQPTEVSRGERTTTPLPSGGSGEDREWATSRAHGLNTLLAVNVR